MAGCAAAFALHEAAVDVTLFEKSRGVSGRAATRRRNGVHYDHGANYIKPHNDRVRDLLQAMLPASGLVTIDPPVWTFDEAGTRAPGDDRDGEKWTYRSGISTVGKLLVEASGATLHRQTRVARVEVQDEGWALWDVNETSLGLFDAVLLTPPAPQTIDLLAASSLPDPLEERLRNALEPADYRSQFSIVLCFAEPLPRPEPWYALVNTDGEHDIAWLSVEDDKPGHVPEGSSVLVVQMAPGWTQAHYDDALEDLVEAVVPLVESLTGWTLPPPAWTDRQRWRYALPNAQADVEALQAGEPHGLFVAGDALVGKGRVSQALEKGLDVAGRIRTWAERR